MLQCYVSFGKLDAWEQLLPRGCHGLCCPYLNWCHHLLCSFVQADGKSQPHPVSASLLGTGPTSKTNTKRRTTPGVFPPRN